MAKKERRAQDTILWTDSIPGVSMVREFYVVLKCTVKRCADLTITDCKIRHWLPNFVWQFFLA